MRNKRSGAKESQKGKAKAGASATRGPTLAERAEEKKAVNVTLWEMENAVSKEWKTGNASLILKVPDRFTQEKLIYVLEVKPALRCVRVCVFFILFFHFVPFLPSHLRPHLCFCFCYCFQ